MIEVTTTLCSEGRGRAMQRQPLWCCKGKHDDRKVPRYVIPRNTNPTPSASGSRLPAGFLTTKVSYNGQTHAGFDTRHPACPGTLGFDSRDLDVAQNSNRVKYLATHQDSFRTGTALFS
nr:hypothetical protein CFP56_00658 [Quercus suber]